MWTAFWIIVWLAWVVGLPAWERLDRWLEYRRGERIRRRTVDSTYNLR